MANAPRGRERHVTGQGKDVYKRGSGLGTGPVGNGGGYSGRGGNSSGGGGGKRSGGGGKSPLLIIILLVVALLGGGGAGVSGLLGGDSGSTGTTQSSGSSQSTGSSSLSGLASALGSSSSSSSLGSLSSLLGTGSFATSSSSTGWTQTKNTGQLDTTVASSARKKYTTIQGNNQDTVTIMVYMCGADLESRSGMATSDLQEMASATLGKNVNIIVYTGGASSWKNSVVSNKTTQIYKVEEGGLKRLEGDMGNKSMTDPATLTSFIKYCKTNYSANRNMLIFWDHGGGSITGFGHDEKFSSSGSMSLKGINQALKDAGTTFDVIGFDACLMATLENALMLSNYADYLIASEETEPGVGWYYTNWLTKLSSNTSMSTIELGKNIADDFVSVCNQKCSGQKTTLSVVDLAELSSTVPEEFSDFATSTLELVKSDQYQTVSNARSEAREFAASNQIDQVDLVSLAGALDTPEAKDLTEALLGAVKYNMTSSNMTNAYGLSIYFPYQKKSYVQNAVSTYDAIGIDSDYSACIQKFASLQAGGQAISGGTSSPLSTLLDSYTGSGTTATSTDMITTILSGLMSGSDLGNVSDLSDMTSLFLGKSIDLESDTQYLAENRFNADQLVWTSSADGTPAMYLADDQWQMVHDLELNLFIDDGKGYIDMGLDNVYDFTEDGGLVGTFSGTWLAINDQPVAYYHTDTVDDGENYTITGYVPAMLNEERVKLIIVFNNENPYGYIAGAEVVYDDDTEVLAKNLLQLEDGDVIDFLCDYYTYEGAYEDTYYLGDQMIVEGDLMISDVTIDASKANAAYCFTDMYNQNYWTPVME